MRHLALFLPAILVIALNTSLLGCSQAAPSSSTAAPAAQPTVAVAPAKKVDWPQKGRAITLVIPYAAGGPSDVMGRLMAPLLQDDLGVSVEVVNKPGASSQAAVTEVAKSKPDGYTIGQMNLPTGLTIYMDPDRQAAFGKKDLQPLAIVSRAPSTIIVKADSPYKNLKDLVDAAKANPGKMSLGAQGYMATTHMATLWLERTAEIRFSIVQFDGAAPDVTALLGGHVDCAVGNVDPPFIASVKAGLVRSLGVMDTQKNKFMPDAATFESQGYPIKSYNAFGWILPAGVPKDVVDVLSASFKKTADNPEFKKRMEEAGLDVDFMGPAQMATFWDDLEVSIKPLMEAAKQEQK